MTAAAILGGDTGAPYWLTRWLLQRSLAGIYLVAFAVAVNQFRPLLGTRGLTPVPFMLEHSSFWRSPSLFFLHYSDGFAMVLSWLGVACAALALAGLSERFGTPVSMVIWGVMWLVYLSIVNVGQTWYAFGWETLLLESGFLAIFLGARNTAPPVIVIWMFRWLVFRIMFGAGLIKLRGDPCWRNLTCLVYHYQSQPMPNPLSWYFNRLPVVVNKAGVVFNHLAELVAPFGVFVPIAWVRRTAGVIIVAFQFMLILSGNLSWLNWLTMVTAVACFDDGFLRRILPIHPGPVEPMALPHQLALGGLAVVVGALSIRPALNLVSNRQLMNASFEPLHLVNTYGAFGSISRERYEVVLEGTTDSVITPATVWKEYQFKAKPGDVSRRPPIVAPYHLRIDWLMWFAALSRDYADPWFVPLAARLLQNDKPTLSLLARDGNPFPDRPPMWLRAQYYQYWFTTPEDHRRTGNWWRRTLVGDYMRPISLQTPGLIQGLEAQGWKR
ncbi:MAG: lipase maturation factor family protein [Gemmatimonadales bacterium]